MSLASFSIKHPVFAWMLMFGFIVFGGIGFSRLGVSQNPDVDFPVVNIDLTMEGAAPEVMELDVVDFIEDSVMAVEGVKEISSVSSQGNADITVEFTLETDINEALQDVQARIGQAGRNLPADLDPPIITKSNPEDRPIMWIALTGTKSPQELAEYAKNVLRDKFLTVEGIGEIRLGGYLDRNVRIWLNADKLREKNLTVGEVTEALSNQHVELPAGRLDAANRVANVRVEGEALDLDQVRNLQIDERGNTPVYLKDVALVEDGFEDRTRVARADGLPAQGLGVIKQRGFSAVEVADAVKVRVEELKETLPDGMQLTVRNDSTKFIKQAIHDIEVDIVLAVLLTAFVCWLFLGSLSSTFNVVLAIPVSVFGTFAFMYFAGFTLNTFSLLALALCIGIVVDDAIMVLENIYRHAEEGEDKVTAAREGAEQITPAALAATLAIIAIFLPVAFMQGIIGMFFFQFGVVLSVAVAISLLEALTLAPSRCAQFLKVSHRGNWLERIVGAAFDKLSTGYKFTLRHALNHRWVVLIVSVVLFTISVFIPFKDINALVANVPLLNRIQFPTGLKSEMMPSADMGNFMIRFTAPVGSSIEYTDRVMAKLESILAEETDVEGQMAIAGTGEMNTGIMFVTLVEPELRRGQTEIMADLRKKMNVIPGTRVVLQDLSQAGFSASRGYPVEFTVRGPDWEQLAESSQAMMTALQDSGTAVDIDTDYRVGLPEVSITPDRQKAMALDVDVRAIANTVNALVGGQRVGKFKDNGRRYDIRVRLLKNERMRPEDISNLYVKNRKGQQIALSEVTKVSVQPSLQSITRKDRQRAITVYANPAPGFTQAEALAVVERARLDLPDGYEAVLSGGSQVYKEAINSLIFAMVLGLFAAYMVLGSQFNSFIHPITVLMALPFSITGALFALWFTGGTINIYSMIGIILLFGIVKKNSILLVDYTNQMRERGMNVREALLHACPVRLRPILMTTFAMVAGAIPGALATGPGSELRAPMFLCIIGGLLVSTLLTLLVVPCFYSVVDQGIRAFKRLFSGRAKHVAPDAGEIMGK
jgi:hydrophobe/amphiphile efflux-1 (HAE1) family protein